MKHKLFTLAFRAFWLIALAEAGLQLEGWLRQDTDGRSLSETDEIRILCMGDSITDGYTRALKTRLRTEFPGRAFKVTQLIKSAGRSDEIVELFERYALELKPHIVITMMGLSDDTSPNRKVPKLLTKPTEAPSKIALVRLWQRWQKKSTEIQMPKEAITWRLPEEVTGPPTKIAPNDPMARQLRESLELAIDGDREGALKKLESVLTQKQWYRTPWLEIASIYSTLQMNDEARTYLTIGSTGSKEMYREPLEYYQAAESALRIHAPELAAVFMDKLTEHKAAEDKGVTTLVRARIARERGQYELALKILEQMAYPERNGITLQASLEHATIVGLQGGGLLNPIWTRAVMPENFYIDLTKKSYARLVELSQQFGFQLVAMQYPLKPVRFLQDTVGPGSGALFVDNEATFQKALQEHGYTKLFLDLHYSGRVGHLNWTSQQILIDNILSVLHPVIERKA